MNLKFEEKVLLVLYLEIYKKNYHNESEKHKEIHDIAFICNTMCTYPIFFDDFILDEYGVFSKKIDENIKTIDKKTKLIKEYTNYFVNNKYIVLSDLFEYFFKTRFEILTFLLKNLVNKKDIHLFAIIMYLKHNLNCSNLKEINTKIKAPKQKTKELWKTLKIIEKVLYEDDFKKEYQKNNILIKKLDIKS